MGEALRALTLRGRGFLAAGITAVVCAVLLGQSDLVRVGVLVALLPLLAAWVISRGRYRLSLVRSVSPPMVSVGQPATVEVTLRNEGSAPTGTLLVEEQLPYVLGTRPRFLLEGIGRTWTGSVGYQVRSDVRGRYEIGPMAVRVTDPFGLVDLGRAFRSTVPLTVTPRTVPLPKIPMGGAWSGAGDNRPRAFAIGSAEDVTVREYRRGDDLRRVHWRSSARVGELMVRREEQPWQARATLLLDNRERAHRGTGLASSLETAVSAAASIAVHLSGLGYTVRLVTASGEEHSHAWHARDAEFNTGALLESLAVVQAAPETRFATDWLGESGAGGLVVGVIGGLDRADAPMLRQILHQSGSGFAIALDVGAWGSPTPTAGSTELLAGQGWRVAMLGPSDKLEASWQGLARTAAHRARLDGAMR